jgi:hypothetical protein
MLRKLGPYSLSSSDLLVQSCKKGPATSSASACSESQDPAEESLYFEGPTESRAAWNVE